VSYPQLSNRNEEIAFIHRFYLISAGEENLLDGSSGVRTRAPRKKTITGQSYLLPSSGRCSVGSPTLLDGRGERNGLAVFAIEMKLDIDLGERSFHGAGETAKHFDLFP